MSSVISQQLTWAVTMKSWVKLQTNGPRCNKLDRLGQYLSLYGTSETILSITHDVTTPKAILFDWPYGQPCSVHWPVIHPRHYDHNLLLQDMQYTNMAAYTSICTY